MPNDLVSIIDELDKPTQSANISSFFNIDFSTYDKYDLYVSAQTNLTCTGLNKFGQFGLVRIQNPNGYTISFNDNQIISQSGTYIIVFGYNNVMIGNPALQQ